MVNVLVPSFCPRVRRLTRIDGSSGQVARPKVESCEPPMSVDFSILQCLSKCSQLNLKIYGDRTYLKNANVLRRTLVPTVKLWRLRGVVAFAIHEVL